MADDSPDEVTTDVARELDRARTAVHDARVLLEGSGSDAGVLNRLYYAAFHAAQAVLYERSVNPSSHGQVRRLFGQHVVLDGDATRDEGRLLGTLYDYRQQADYGREPRDADVVDLLHRTEEFVDRMESIADAGTND